MRKPHLLLLFFIILPACSTESTHLSEEQHTNEQSPSNYSQLAESQLNKNPQNKIIETDLIQTKYSGSEEKIAEINQQLNYYCMKKKHYQRFKSEKRCLIFVKNSLQKCEIRYAQADKNIINCVKKKLGLK